MNINVNVPEATLERLLSALERIAVAAELMVHPIITYDNPKPYPPDMWETMTNAKRLTIEEEERQEQAGFGRGYQSAIEAAIPKRSDSGADS